MAKPSQPNDPSVRFADLRFILEGSARSLTVLSIASVLAAFSETFLLASVVQAISALSAHRSSVAAHLGSLTLTNSVPLVLAAAVGAAVLRAALTGVIALIGPRIAARSRERHRRQLFSAYLSADWATQSADKTGRFVQTLVSAVNDANAIILLLTQAVPALVTLIVLMVVATLLNPLVTLALIALAIIVGLVLTPVTRRAHHAARRDAAGRNAIASHVAGVLTAGAEIAVLGARGGILREGDARIRRADQAFGKSQGLKRLVSTAGQSVAFIMAAAGLWLVSVAGWSLNFTTVGTITVLLLRAAGLAQQLQTSTSQYGMAKPFIEQVRTLIATYRTNRQRYGTARFPDDFDISVDDVAYTYPNTSRAAVSVARATFSRGQSYAILGPSGSGKSTLIQLLLRLRPPSQGQINVGEVPLHEISDDEFSARVAYVPQSPHLIPGTMLENIRFYRPTVTREAVVAAARRAHIHTEIEQMVDGYETVVDAHVDILSGGQKQRLALARALANSPAILVLDEPTSALDSVSEAAVIDTLRRLHGETTVIMITHKESSTRYCDDVLRLESGELSQVRDDGVLSGATHPSSAAIGEP